MEALAAYLEHPSDTHFEGQEKKEKIFLLLRRHWVTNISWLGATLLMIFLPLLLMQSTLSLGIKIPVPPSCQAIALFIWYLLTLAYALESFLNWYFNVLIITNKRIVDIDFWGLLWRNVSECPLERVQDVTYKIGGLLPTFFNFGDVYVQTAGEKREFEFFAVPNPEKVHDKLTDWVEEAIGGRSLKKK